MTNRSQLTSSTRTRAALLICLGVLAFAAVGSSGALAQSRHAALTRHALVAHGMPVARPATAAATAKFLLHAGLAFYVFDHFIWKPYKAGELHGFTHKLKIIEAGVAALFVYHEAKLMVTDVKASKLLSFLATPITAVVNKLASLKSAITGGHFSAVTGMQSSLGAIKQQSNAKGVVIKEIVHSVL
ncbi:MAG: hypothetical protein KGL16_09555 [Acidobacteriota bacterium]|nr:hypothetical protein [Acidobacteriota bacterium]